MTYRSADAALEERLEDVTREIADLDARLGALASDIEASEQAAEALRTKIQHEGPGGGRVGATLLRIPFIVGTLLTVGLLALAFSFYIGGYVHKQPEETIVPILMLDGPAILAAVVAWPYRRLGSTYVGGLVAAAVMLGLSFTIIAAGATGVLR